jgi:heme-degrading monooxygenase HmoA
MPIEIRSEIPGMTREMYEQAVPQIEAKLKGRPGFIAHLAGPLDGSGYRVVEFWESEEQFNRWIQEEILPLAQKVGIPPFQPKILPGDKAFTRS